jgi:hypothetical protein
MALIGCYGIRAISASDDAAPEMCGIMSAGAGDSPGSERRSDGTRAAAGATVARDAPRASQIDQSRSILVDGVSGRFAPLLMIRSRHASPSRAGDPAASFRSQIPFALKNICVRRSARELGRQKTSCY